jgi:hypothetical protein
MHGGSPGYTGTIGYDSINNVFARWDATLATPAWVAVDYVKKTVTSVADVAESATPTAVEEKLNELLAALRTSGIIT